MRHFPITVPSEVFFSTSSNVPVITYFRTTRHTFYPFIATFNVVEQPQNKIVSIIGFVTTASLSPSQFSLFLKANNRKQIYELHHTCIIVTHLRYCKIFGEDFPHRSRLFNISLLKPSTGRHIDALLLLNNYNFFVHLLLCGAFAIQVLVLPSCYHSNDNVLRT